MLWTIIGILVLLWLLGFILTRGERRLQQGARPGELWRWPRGGARVPPTAVVPVPVAVEDVRRGPDLEA
jgi:hypothetical protein